MISILDFDYTIFDADRFKREGLSRLSRISGDSFLAYYQARFKDQGLNYDPSIQIKELQLSLPEQVERIKELSELLRNINDYLFPETVELILNLQKKSDRMILATHGDPGWQKQKVSHLSIGGVKAERIFDEIIFEGGKKNNNEQLLKLKGEELWLVNDNARECLELKQSLGGRVVVFLLDGPYSRNVQHRFRIFSRQELVEELKNFNKN